MNMKAIPLLLIISTRAQASTEEFYKAELRNAQENIKKAMAAEQKAQEQLWQTDEGKIYQQINAEFSQNCRGDYNDWNTQCKKLHLARHEAKMNLEKTNYYSEDYRRCAAHVISMQNIEIGLRLILSVQAHDDYDNETKSQMIENIITHNAAMAERIAQDIVTAQNRANDELRSLIKKANISSQKNN
jgi:hypothetical protein